MNRIFNFGKHKNNEEKGLSLLPLGTFDIDAMLGEFFAFPSGLTGRTNAPAIEVYEKDNKVVVKAELPGIDKKDIKIGLERDILTISAETKAEKEEKKRGYYYSERSFGSMQRSIRLPEGIKTEDIKASYKDGILKIEAPIGEDKKQSKPIGIE
jgi:HSP20 family protein